LNKKKRKSASINNQDQIKSLDPEKVEMSKQLETYIQEEVQPAPLITDENFFVKEVQPKAQPLAPTPILP
jgi:hypothetical protein